MSLAGARSSLGDDYQHYVALQWAVCLLLGEKDLRSIEVEVTSLGEDGHPMLVDDIVIRFEGALTRYLQCKKNSPNQGEWTVTHLRPELLKVAVQLEQDPKGEVVFHSRSNFAIFRRVRERLDLFPDIEAFKNGLPTPLEGPFFALVKIWEEAIPGCSLEQIFQSLRRISYATPMDIEDMHRQCRLQLSWAYANPDAVLDTLWGILTRSAAKLGDGGRAQYKHVFSRHDLEEAVFRAGFNRSPNRSEADILATFQQTSAIGRAWPREIEGVRLRRTAAVDLVNAVKEGIRSVLLTDEPGSGKTCLLLDLVEHLEEEIQAGVLFIQCRQFEACEEEEALTQAGLPENVAGQVERLASHRHVVVIMDSLDVLALARNHQPLRLFLRLLDRLLRIGNVTVVAACRTFDLKNDSSLSGRSWDRTLHIGPLDWGEEILPLLSRLGVNPEPLSPSLRILLGNPRNLALFAKIVAREPMIHADTEQELADRYLETVVLKDPKLGDEALDCLIVIAERMIAQRRTKLLEASAGVPHQWLDLLKSAQILIEPSAREVAFGHQTLIDILAIRAVLARGGDLLSFLNAHEPVAFIRPIVRAFFLFLRTHDPERIPAQLRAVLESQDVAYHLKRLLVESLAECAPRNDDSDLIRILYRTQKPLFRIFLARIKDPIWLDLLDACWWVRAVANRDEDIIYQFHWALRHFVNIAPMKVLEFWHRLLNVGWLDRGRVGTHITMALLDFKHWTEPGVTELLEILLNIPKPDHDFLGQVLSAWVTQTNQGDELLWRYITLDSKSEDDAHPVYGWDVHCDADTFYDRKFLKQRMEISETLLDLAIDSLERRTRQAFPNWEVGNDPNGYMLSSSTWRYTHHGVSHYPMDGGSCLLEAIEYACLSHARRNTSWWRTREAMMAEACDSVLRYIHLKACTANPESNLIQIRSILTNRGPLTDQFNFEIGQLIQASFILLDAETQEIAQKLFLEFGKDYEPIYGDTDRILLPRRNLLASVPAYLRIPEAQVQIDLIDKRSVLEAGLPEITLTELGGGPAFTEEELSQLSNEGVVTLLRYLESGQTDPTVSLRERIFPRDLVEPLRRFAMHDPDRAVGLIRDMATRVSMSCFTSLAEGLARHLQVRRGSLQVQNWAPVGLPNEEVLSLFLLETLERHPDHWRRRACLADIMQEVALHMENAAHAERATFLLWGLSHHQDPIFEREDDGHISVALNSARGRAAMAALQLANHLLERDVNLPSLLVSLLNVFASDPHPGVREAVVNILPFTQSKAPEFGWVLFERCLANPTPSLWRASERCLYYGYSRHYDRVGAYLNRILSEGIPDAGAAWGRISALVCISGFLSLDSLFQKLGAITNSAAWEGVANVFASNLHLNEHRITCLEGLRCVLRMRPEDSNIGQYLGEVFSVEPLPSLVPLDLIQAFFEIQKTKPPSTYAFMKWIVPFADEEPDQAMEAMEILANSESVGNIHDHDALTTVLTTLLREGEGREAVDQGEFLRRAIRVQDKLMEKNAYGLEEWLGAIERS